MKKYHVFKSDISYSQTLFLIPEDKKDIIKSFKKNKFMKYLCKAAIQKNFIDKCFVNGKDYYSLYMGE